MATYEHLNHKVEKFRKQSEDLSVRIPEVMQKRISMIAQQNPLNNDKELKEIEQMFTEKPIAFLESWQQMAWQSIQAQQNLTQLMFKNWIRMSLGQPISYENLLFQFNQETMLILEKGMQPIYKCVTANAKRLK